MDNTHQNQLQRHTISQDRPARSTSVKVDSPNLVRFHSVKTLSNPPANDGDGRKVRASGVWTTSKGQIL